MKKVPNIKKTRKKKRKKHKNIKRKERIKTEKEGQSTKLVRARSAESDIDGAPFPWANFLSTFCNGFLHYNTKLVTNVYRIKGIYE